MSDRKTCSKKIKMHPHCQSSLSSSSSSSPSSSLFHAPGPFYNSSPSFDHNISKYHAWSRIQIISQLLTNNFRTYLPAFCEHGKYIQRQNIGQLSVGISTQTKHFSLFSILLPVLPTYISNYVSQFTFGLLLSSLIT
jgi:hypothetical protein